MFLQNVENMDALIIKQVKEKLFQLAAQPATGTLAYRQGQNLYVNGQINLLSHSGIQYDFVVDDHHGDFYVNISTEKHIVAECTCKSRHLCRHQAAALMQLHELLKLQEEATPTEGIKYSRKGMMKRVVEERVEKAQRANYKIEFADNIYGEHHLTNEKGLTYRLTFRDLERKHGYCSCPDYGTNKLGTCKHLIYAFENLNRNMAIVPEVLPVYPFIEVFLNPFRELKISWFYPEKPIGAVAELLYRYFGNKNYIEDDQVEQFLGFLNNASGFKQILVRPEVMKKVEKAHEAAALKQISKNAHFDFSLLNKPLLPYQETGVQFVTFKTGAILADEIGLDKTSQAIAAAIMKKQFLGFRSTLVICPSSLKITWKNTIESLTNEHAIIVQGTTEERTLLYQSGEAFFKIVNFDTLVRDQHIIRLFPPDLVTIDDAQKIKNYTTVTSSAIKSIPRRHTLLLTSSPPESDLLELYSLVLFVDQELLTPLWEFSYQHCYFNPENKNKVVGYYDLDVLWQRINKIVLRRTKSEVIKQLPQIINLDVPVKTDTRQVSLQIKFASEALSVLSQNIITPYDVRKLSILFEKLRMTASSVSLVEESAKTAPKTDELKNILVDKLRNPGIENKVVIITSWQKMSNLIQRMLRIQRINFVEIQPDMPSHKKKELALMFGKNQDVNVLLTTDDNAKAINFQLVDTIINFDISENTYSRNHWPGTIDPLVNRNKSLTIINLISENSVEEIFRSYPDNHYLAIHNLAAIQAVVDDGKIRDFWVDKLSNLLMILQNLPLPFDESTEKPADGRQMLMDFEDDADYPHDYRAVILSGTNPEILPETKTENPEFDKEIMEKAVKGGISIISELYKASTGAEIQLLNESLTINSDTNEIIIRLKKVKK